MAMLAWVFGFLGGVCMILGFITITEVIPPLNEGFTWIFWFAVSGLLLLITIAFAIGGGRGGEY
ncbi:MAG: TMEM43 family protein [Dehalococcoidia bacterium]|nr:TMEM43 family protein [Dehalococcoidia bacterium]